MFDNLKNMASILSQAKEMRQKMELVQEELTRMTVEGQAGAGAVRVTMNGRFEVQRVQLDRPLLSALAGQGADVDARMVEDLIAGAVNDAMTQAQALAKDKMLTATGLGGMNIPGLM